MMRIETHTHTGNIDIVASISPEDMVYMNRDIGCGGVAITNHYFPYLEDWYPEKLKDIDHAGYIDFYLEAYRRAKAVGDKENFPVFLGIELRFRGKINDYLVYGLTEEFLYDSPRLCELTLDKFLEIKPSDALVYQAHPFRNDMEVTDPKKLFGVEVSNGSTDPRRNAMAEAWAAVWGLHRISGSDCHRPPQLGRGGIITMHDVHTDKELVELLRSDDYTLISRVEPK